nr:uncharacterized protein LOC113828547 isoform X2 [Penaeus vannamei]
MGVVVVLARGRGRRIRGVGAVRGRRRWLSAPPPDGRHTPGKHHGHRRGHRRPLHQAALAGEAARVPHPRPGHGRRRRGRGRGGRLAGPECPERRLELNS